MRIVNNVFLTVDDTNAIVVLCSINKANKSVCVNKRCNSVSELVTLLTQNNITTLNSDIHYSSSIDEDTYAAQIIEDAFDSL